VLLKLKIYHADEAADFFLCGWALHVQNALNFVWLGLDA
jgi:hypothetical protein